MILCDNRTQPDVRLIYVRPLTPKMVLKYHPHRATLFHNLDTKGTPYYMAGSLFISLS